MLTLKTWVKVIISTNESMRVDRGEREGRVGVVHIGRHYNCHTPVEIFSHLLAQQVFFSVKLLVQKNRVRYRICSELLQIYSRPDPLVCLPLMRGSLSKTS